MLDIIQKILLYLHKFRHIVLSLLVFSFCANIFFILNYPDDNYMIIFYRDAVYFNIVFYLLSSLYPLVFRKK